MGKPDHMYPILLNQIDDIKGAIKDIERASTHLSVTTRAAMLEECSTLQRKIDRLTEEAKKVRKEETEKWFNGLSATDQAKMRWKGFENTHPHFLPYGWSIDPEKPDRAWKEIVRNDPEHKRWLKLREEDWKKQFPMYKSYKDKNKQARKLKEKR